MAKALIAAACLLALAGVATAGGSLNISPMIPYSTNCHEYPKIPGLETYVIIVNEITLTADFTPISTTSVKIYNDANCVQGPVTELHFNGTATNDVDPRTIPNAFPVSSANNSDVHYTNFTVTGRTITINDGTFLGAFAGICPEYPAETQPVLYEPFDILEKGCVNLGIPPQADCPVEYDIAQSIDNGEAFVNGLRTAASPDDTEPDVCDPTKRPHLLNTLFIYANDPADYPVPTNPPTQAPTTQAPTTEAPTATPSPTAGAAQALPLLAAAVGIAVAALQM